MQRRMQRSAQALPPAIAALGNLENEAWGVEFAYRYDASPLIAPILAVDPGGLPPPDDPAAIPALPWPGMRAPSFICRMVRRSLISSIRSGFTLLRFNPDALDTAAMEQTGAPVTQIDRCTRCRAGCVRRGLGVGPARWPPGVAW